MDKAACGAFTQRFACNFACLLFAQRHKSPQLLIFLPLPLSILFSHFLLSFTSLIFFNNSH